MTQTQTQAVEAAVQQIMQLVQKLDVSAARDGAYANHPSLRTEEAYAAVEAALRAELARPQEVTDAEVYRAKALIGFADNEPTRRALQDFLANRAATSTKPADSAAVPCEPVGHLYTIAGVQHCTIQKVLPDGPLYTTPQAPTAQPLAPVQQNQATGGSIWDIGRMGIYGAAPSMPLKEGV